MFSPRSKLALDFTWDKMLRNLDSPVKHQTYDHIEGALNQAMDWLEQTKRYHPDYPDKLCTLAGLYQSLAGDNTVAEELLRKALVVAETRDSPAGLQIAVPLNSLGLLLLQQRRSEEAEVLFQRQLKLVENRLGEEHIEVATTLENLAAVQRQAGRTDEASKTRARATQIRSKARERNLN
jgi:Tfp pilus assembly protein PilF